MICIAFGRQGHTQVKLNQHKDHIHVCFPLQVTLTAVAEAVGSVQDVYFVLFQEPLYNVFIETAKAMVSADKAAAAADATETKTDL